MTRRSVSALLLAALLLGAPLLFGRVLAGHDARTYLAYAEELRANAREGLLLPSWAPELNGGYGGPGLLLYPPLVHVLDAALLAAGIRAGVATGLVALALLLASGLSCLAWLRAEGLQRGALAGALAYMAAPYRLVDLYERSALSEHAAFVFPPLVLLALASVGSTRRRVALAGLALAGLALTNLPMLVLFAATLLAVTAAKGARRLAELAGAGALGAGIAAFALVPAALASRWTVTELFYGAAAPGFRPSENTIFSARSLLPGFSLRVSGAVLATAALSALAFAFATRGRERSVWGAVGLLAFAGTLPFAGPLWDALPVVSRLQFPWRLAAPATLALAALVAAAPAPRRAFAVAALAAACALPFLGSMTVPRSLLPEGPVPPAAPGVSFPDPRAVFEAEGLATSPWLSNPKLADVWYLPRTLGPALADEVFRGGPQAIPALGGAPAAGAAKVRVVSWARRVREVEVTASAETSLVLHALAFPGMRVLLDGAPTRAGWERATGLLALRVPAGVHRVAFGWEPFATLRAARAVSGLALLLAAALLLWKGAAPTP